MVEIIVLVSDIFLPVRFRKHSLQCGRGWYQVAPRHIVPNFISLSVGLDWLAWIIREDGDCGSDTLVSICRSGFLLKRGDVLVNVSETPRCKASIYVFQNDHCIRFSIDIILESRHISKKSESEKPRARVRTRVEGNHFFQMFVQALACTTMAPNKALLCGLHVLRTNYLQNMWLKTLCRSTRNMFHSEACVIFLLNGSLSSSQFVKVWFAE